MTVRRRMSGDDGQITVLVLGYTAVAALLVVVGIDASAAFLARRALTAAADDAAVAAAGSVDTTAIYAGGLRCGQPLPLDPGRAQAAAQASIASDIDLRRGFSDVAAPATGVSGATVSVALTARARLPLGSVIGLLDPGARDGVLIHVTSHADSPTVAPGGC